MSQEISPRGFPLERQGAFRLEREQDGPLNDEELERITQAFIRVVSEEALPPLPNHADDARHAR